MSVTPVAAQPAVIANRPWEFYSNRQRWLFLAILFLVCASNYIDRQVMSVLIEPIKREFDASDTQMGLLSGLAFALLYAVLGIPVARLADRGNRKAVIGVALVVWSAATAVCGLVGSFWQLFAARVVVGIGEAGAIPPSQSLIADYFAPAQRTRALSVYMTAATVGYLVAFMAGAQIAAQYGWRAAFLLLGLPGLLLAPLVWFGLKEPREVRTHGPVDEDQATLRTSLLQLFRKRTYVLLTIATALYFLVAYGAFVWFPPYMQRVLHVDLVKVGAVFGLMSAGGTLVGTIAGGWLSDRLSRRGLKWRAWTPGIALLISCPLQIATMLRNDFAGFIALSFLAGLPLAAAVPAMFGLIHMVCGSSRRALAVAINFFFANLIGLGLGPVLTGYLSDRFTAVYGPVGLRFAIIIALLILIPAALCYMAAASSLERDLEG